MTEILLFLALWGCTNPTLDIHVNPDAKYPGYYHQSGWIEVRPNVPDTVLIHELAHSCGANEQEAHRLQLLWENR